MQCNKERRARVSKNEKRKVKLNAETFPLVKRLVRDYVRRHAWRLALAIGCMLLVAGATAGMAQVMEPLVNEVFDERDADAINTLALSIAIIFAAKGIGAFGQGVLMSYVGNRVVADVQQDLFRKLMAMDLAYYNNNSPGTMISRFTNDVNRLRNSTTDTLVGFGRDLFTALALIGVMFYQDWLLALLAMIVIPVVAGPIIAIGRRMRRVSRSNQVEMGRFNTLLDESFQGVRHVKAYGMEGYETKRANRVIDEVFRLSQKAAVTRAIVNPITEMAGGLAIVAVLLYGAEQVLSAEGGDPGSFFAFITAVLLAYEPLKRLAKLNTNLQEGLAAAERIFEVLDSQPTIFDAPDAKPLKVAGGEVVLEDVNFSYHVKAPALNGLSLTAPAGKTIALVGPSGAGKTTILNLLPRFFDVDSGNVKIDGQDVRTLTLDSLRASLALVSQDIVLFDETVRTNIRYGRTDATQEEIEEAARHAGAHDFISRLPDGYETQVGPRGVKLSGGQRQRIAIARAMIKNAPILLLDEATSALDTQSERHVQEALKTLMIGRTTLVIAHRLSTVVDADIIFVMEDGRVVESGNHQELLAKQGIYARLSSQQLLPDAEPEDDDQSLAPAGS
ncbi:MAG: ABC transporter ATP-binding protein [Rhodospirillales bacterium]